MSLFTFYSSLRYEARKYWEHLSARCSLLVLLPRTEKHNAKQTRTERGTIILFQMCQGSGKQGSISTPGSDRARNSVRQSSGPGWRHQICLVMYAQLHTDSIFPNDTPPIRTKSPRAQIVVKRVGYVRNGHGRTQQSSQSVVNEISVCLSTRSPVFLALLQLGGWLADVSYDILTPPSNLLYTRLSPAENRGL